MPFELFLLIRSSEPEGVIQCTHSCLNGFGIMHLLSVALVMCSQSPNE